MNIQQLNDTCFQTSDLSLVTAISLFYPIDAIDRSNPNRIVFSFKRENGLDELIQGFWSNDLKVSPLLYFNQLKVVKSRIYGEKDYGQPTNGS